MSNIIATFIKIAEVEPQRKNLTALWVTLSVLLVVSGAGGVAFYIIKKKKTTT